MDDGGQSIEPEPEAAPRRSRMLTLADMARHREAVLQAALHVFLDQGYKGASIAAVAERAGVAAHVPAHYFGGKRMLFIRVRRDLRERLLARLQGGEPEGAALRAVITALAETLLGPDWTALERLGADPGVPVGEDADWAQGAVHRVAFRLEQTGEAGSPVIARQAARFLLDVLAAQKRGLAREAAPLSPETVDAVGAATTDMVRCQIGLWNAAWGAARA